MTLFSKMLFIKEYQDDIPQISPLSAQVGSAARFLQPLAFDYRHEAEPTRTITYAGR
jgi:hypothetical protein